jgi:hypothetical protein
MIDGLSEPLGREPAAYKLGISASEAIELNFIDPLLPRGKMATALHSIRFLKRGFSWG